MNVLALALVHTKQQCQGQESGVGVGSGNLTRQYVSQVDMRTGKDLQKGILWLEKREGSKMTD